MASHPFIPDEAILSRRVMSRTRARPLGYSRTTPRCGTRALSFRIDPLRGCKMVHSTIAYRDAGQCPDYAISSDVGETMLKIKAARAFEG